MRRKHVIYTSLTFPFCSSFRSSNSVAAGFFSARLLFPKANPFCSAESFCRLLQSPVVLFPSSSLPCHQGEEIWLPALLHDPRCRLRGEAICPGGGDGGEWAEKFDVVNLPWDFSAPDIEKLFSQYGTVKTNRGIVANLHFFPLFFWKLTGFASTFGGPEMRFFIDCR